MELIVAVRSIHMGAAVLVAGTFAFRFLVWPRPRPANAAGAALERWLRMSAACAMIAALATWAMWLVLIAATMSGASPGSQVLETVLTRTNFGQVWMLRLGLGLLVLIELALRRPGRGHAALPAMGAVAATLFLVSLAWAGHAISGPPPWRALHLGADSLHLLGAGLWLGALAPLCFVLHQARNDGAQSWRSLAAAATRAFSKLGVVAVLMILLTGLVNTALQVGSFAALRDTPYGQRLSVKIALFFAILAIAAYNRWRLVPQADARATAQPRELSALYRNALVELVLGCAIIALVGLLGNMAPSSHLHEREMHHSVSP